jgi:small redox-active disulfide protein 2
MDEEKKETIVSVKVLGSGCSHCHKLYENAQKAVKNAGLSCPVDYVTDMEKVIGYGVTSTPAFMIDDKIVSMGKVLTVKEIGKLLVG